MKKIILCFIYLFAVSNSFCQTVTNEDIFATSRLKYVLGQDGVTPIEIENKQGKKMLLWTFGDTILGEWTGEITTDATMNFNDITKMNAMPPNAIALSSIINNENYKDPQLKFLLNSSGTVKQFIEYTKDENPFALRLWADDGIQIGNKTYVYYMIIKSSQSDFSILGTGLASWEMPDKWEIKDIDFKRKLDFKIKDIILGDGVIKKGKYVYILSRSEKDGKTFGYLSFAKVKAKDIENPLKYRYLNSKGKWTKKNSGKFFGDICGEASLSYNQKTKKFRIVYMSLKDQKIKMIVFDNFKN
ncbi:MAG: DUF4185 domain-containing protein [Elusimicrobia bacterium]|nr:DUF4185 domain-containing protein [Elusimicrobiota bacterium]